MILKASQRGGARQLGQHLLNIQKNEHVEVHEVRGFMADDVMGAMTEAQAMAMGTKCRQHLFSVSFNPPQDAMVSNEEFENAFRKVEEEIGLTDQPRIIVFHEKEGRRHAHAVWSRIDANETKAVQLSYFKNKLKGVSRELFVEHGWEIPKGLRDKKNRDPRNFTLAEWQQAKRMGNNAKDLKIVVQDAWNISDNRQSFERALEERGMFLARGDKRGHVAVTYEGQAISIAKYAGKKAKDVRARLGKPDDLRSVAETHEHIISLMTPLIKNHLGKLQRDTANATKPLNVKRQVMTQAHRQERQRLRNGQLRRWQTEERARTARVQKGLKGVWQKLSGKHAQIRKQNETETYAAHKRDKAQQHELRIAQMHERQKLQAEIQQQRREHVKQQTKLYKDLASYQRLNDRQTPTPHEHQPSTPKERLERLRQNVKHSNHGRSLER